MGSILLASGAVGTWGLGQFNNALYSTYYEALQPIVIITSAQARFLDTRAEVRNVLLEKEPTRTGPLKEAILQNLSDLKLELENYRHVFSTEQELTEFQWLQTVVDTWQSTLQQALARVEEGNKQAAQVIVNGTGEAQGRVIQERIHNLVQLAQEKAKATYENGQADYLRLRQTFLIFVLAGTLFGVGFALLMVRNITLALNKGLILAEALAEGDLTREVGVQGKDELSVLVHSLNTASQSLRSALRKVVEAVQTMAASTHKMSFVTEESKRASENITAAIQQMAGGTSDQAANTQKVAALVTQIVEAMDRSSQRVKEVAMTAQQTHSFIEEGLQAVDEQNRRMEENDLATESASTAVEALIRQTKEIEQILVMITQIAEQTNLLALNAAIEAARAGEYGRGFAVVADEVRKLADGSGEAAKEITHILQSIQTMAARAIAEMARTKTTGEAQKVAVRRTTNAFQTIFAAMQGMVASIQEISFTIDETSKSAQSIVGSVHNISAVAQENAANAEQISVSVQKQEAGMDEITHSAENLARLATYLETTVAGFKL